MKCDICQKETGLHPHFFYNLPKDFSAHCEDTEETKVCDECFSEVNAIRVFAKKTFEAEHDEVKKREEDYRAFLMVELTKRKNITGGETKPERKWLYRRFNKEFSFWYLVSKDGAPHFYSNDKMYKMGLNEPDAYTVETSRANGKDHYILYERNSDGFCVIIPHENGNLTLTKEQAINHIENSRDAHLRCMIDIYGGVV